MKLRRAVPALPVRDVERSVVFYREVLGFELAYGEESFAALTHGGPSGVELHLWRTRRGLPGASPRLAGSASCRLEVGAEQDLQTFELRCRTAGVVHPRGALADTDHGTREFSVLDPDGNQVTLVLRRH